jgi:Ca2+/H+ antiporter
MGGLGHQVNELERSERMSFGIALAIALLPIPAALLISWALGNPPWRARPDRGDLETGAAEHGHP